MGADHAQPSIRQSGQRIQSPTAPSLSVHQPAHTRQHDMPTAGRYHLLGKATAHHASFDVLTVYRVRNRTLLDSTLVDSCICLARKATKNIGTPDTRRSQPPAHTRQHAPRGGCAPSKRPWFNVPHGRTQRLPCCVHRPPPSCAPPHTPPQCCITPHFTTVRPLRSCHPVSCVSLTGVVTTDLFYLGGGEGGGGGIATRRPEHLETFEPWEFQTLRHGKLNRRPPPPADPHQHLSGAGFHQHHTHVRAGAGALARSSCPSGTWSKGHRNTADARVTPTGDRHRLPPFDGGVHLCWWWGWGLRQDGTRRIGHGGMRSRRWVSPHTTHCQHSLSGVALVAGECMARMRSSSLGEAQLLG